MGDLYNNDATDKQMKIRPVSPVEFDLFYGDLQDKNRRDAYLASCSAPCDAILSAFLRDAPAGYAVCRVEKRTGGIRLSVQAMFVREECRRRGVAKALLAEAENLCRASETGVGLVKLCLVEGSGSFSSGSEFLLANGYALTGRAHLVTCDAEGDPGYGNWERYMKERGDRLVQWLMDAGFRAVPFEDADEDVMQALRRSMFSEYANELNILPFLDGKGGRLLKSVSSVALLDGKPVAYCLTTGPDDASVVFEQISAAKTHRNTGAIFLALALSMRRFRELGYRRAAYAVYESNPIALSFVGRIFGKMTNRTNVQSNFEKICKI